MKSCFLDAIQGKNTGRPPVWLMRQAGRYLPEYQRIRAQHSFWEMCHNPDLIVEVTQLPLQRYAMDAAVLFSDILFVPEILGCGVSFIEGVGPVLEHKIATREDVQALPQPSVGEALQPVYTAIRRLKQELEVPLIGFCGGVYTVASYMIEGRSSRDLPNTKRWMYEDPEGFHHLLQRLTDLSIEHLNEQAAAGADVLQVFDSWAQTLPHRQFMEFSLPYMRKIVEALQPTGVPVLLFCRGSSAYYSELATVQPAGISLDWNADLAHVRRQVGPNLALQGNLDPQLLCCKPEVVEREVQALLRQMQGDPAFIVNLGHGITPEAHLDSVQALVDTVHSFSPATV